MKNNAVKKCLSVLIAVLMCVSVMAPLSAFATERKTTVPEGYTPIYSAADFNNIRNNLSGKFILMNDISCGGLSIMGTFSGELDGNGYTVSGYSVSANRNAYVGLFMYISGCYIHDITFASCSVYGESDGQGRNYTGLIAGYGSGTFERVTLRGCSVSARCDNDDMHAGGFVGYATGLTITDCLEVSCTVNAFSSGSKQSCHAGGIMGYNGGGATITNCIVYANSIYCSGQVADNRAGAFAGRNVSSINAYYFYTNNGSFVGNGNGIGGSNVYANVSSFANTATFSGFNFNGVWTTNGSYPVLAFNDMSALRTAVNTTVLAEDKYTPDSYAVYAAKLAAANDILTNNKSAAQSVIDTATSELTAAINALDTDYVITFVDENDDVISVNTVDIGEMPTIPEIPAKDPDALYHYVASGWDSEVTTVSADKTYKAVYTPVAHSGGAPTCTSLALCTVCGTAYGDMLSHTFSIQQNDETNHWYKCQNCDATDTPAAHTYIGVPGNNNTHKVVCSVCGYLKTDAEACTFENGECTFCGQKKIYTVTFTCDGETLSSQTVRHGSKPAEPVKPVKQPTESYHYSEGYWNSEVVAATEDKEYKLFYDSFAHTGGTATCAAKAVCSVCGTSYGEQLPHTGMDDFICDECEYYDAAGALAAAKASAIAAVEDAVTDGAPYGVAAVADYAIIRINNATAIDAVNAEKEAALAAIDALVNDKSAALAEAETALAEAQAALTEAQTALADKTAALDETKAQLNTANAALAAAQTQIDTLTADLTDAQTELADNKAALKTAETEKAALEAALTEKETALAELNSTLGAKEEDIAALEDEISGLEASITAKDGEITALEATVAANETAIAAAETQIETLTSDLTAAQSQVEMLNAALTEAQNALAAKDTALAEANENLATANAALTTANAQISSLTDDVDKMTVALALAEGNLSTANNAIVNAEARIDELTAALTEANTALVAKETALAEANTALTAAENAKTALETQLAAKEAELVALKESADANADEIAALEAELADLEAELTAMNNEIAAKTNEINTLQAGAAAYETAITEAQNEIAAKNSEITSLKTRLNKALADIEALKAGTYVEPEDDGTCKYCGKEHKNVFDKFFCMIIRFFDFLISVFEFSSAT